jgi:periplasmic divalent cation tolerance protein
VNGTDCLLVTITAPSETLARTLAETAVAEHLAACAQVHGPIASFFRWEGRPDQATEWRCSLKTTRAAYPALEERIRGLHPYTVAEIVATPIVAGSAAYLEWVRQSVVGER